MLEAVAGHCAALPCVMSPVVRFSCQIVELISDWSALVFCAFEEGLQHSEGVTSELLVDPVGYLNTAYTLEACVFPLKDVVELVSPATLRAALMFANPVAFKSVGVLSGIWSPVHADVAGLQFGENCLLAKYRCIPESAFVAS